jgi:hypothetical protein
MPLFLSRQRQFEEDIGVLLDVLGAPSPLTPAKVRLVAAATVRKWLLDGNINLLAREVGARLELPAYDTSEVFSGLDATPDIQFYLAGGVRLGGIQIRSMYTSGADATAAPPVPVETKVALFTPGKFLSSRRLFHAGRSFTAEQILLYAANKIGGVHIDPLRTPLQASLEAASAYMTFGNPHGESKATVHDLAEPGGPCLVVIPPERGNRWTAVEIELLSAAQSLVSVHCNGVRLVQLAGDA